MLRRRKPFAHLDSRRRYRKVFLEQLEDRRLLTGEIPTLVAIADVTIAEDAPEETIPLSGITAGDGETQPLRLSLSNPNATLTGARLVSPGSLEGRLTTELFAHYSLDNTPQDSSGNNRHGILSDPAKIKSAVDRFGNPDSAYEIQPRASIDVSPENSLRPHANSGHVTYSIWLKPSSDGIVLNQYSHMNVNQSHFFLAVHPDSVVLTGQGTDAFNPSLTSAMNEWHHYVIGYHGQTGDVDIWADGIFVGTSNIDINPTSSSNQPFRIGFLPNAAANDDQTMIVDDVSVFNRSLSDDEVIELYTRSAVAVTPEPNQHGTTTITVAVEDGGLDNDIATIGDNATTSQSFDVTVNPVNDAPTLDPLADLTIDEDAPEQTVNLSGITAGGGEFQPLKVSLASSNSVLADARLVSPASLSGSLTTDLFAHYSLDNTTEDSSGNDRHGVLSDSSKIHPAMDRFGNPDSAYEIQPRASIDVSPANSLRPHANSGHVTYSMWIKPSNASSALNQYRNMDVGQSHFYFSVHSDHLNLAGQGTDYYRPSFESSLNEWHHYVIGYHGQTGDVDVWADGQFLGRGNVDINPSSSTDQPFRIGFLPNAGAMADETMFVDDVSVFNRNLSDDEVIQLYTRSAVAITPEPDQHGTTTITVTVEDGGGDNDLSTSDDNLSTSKTFDVTVNPVNDPPTLDQPRIGQVRLVDTGAGNVGHIRLADVDRDGNVDIVTSNNAPSSFSVLLGDGDGRFATPIVHDVAHAVMALDTGDVNGDGFVDVILGHYWDNLVTIHLGNENGGFELAETIPVGGGVFYISAEDLNNDRKDDLVISKTDADDIGIILSIGVNEFSPMMSISVGDGPDMTVIGDFNNDGHQDVIVELRNADQIAVLLGDGSGAFGGIDKYDVGDGPYGIAYGDFDSNGHLDIVTANHLEKNVTILFGDGNGAFGELTRVATDARAARVAVADYDLDGALDLFVTQFNNEVIYHRGDGNGGFTKADTFEVPSPERFLSMGDINGDLAPEILVATAGSGIAVLPEKYFEDSPSRNISLAGISAGGGETQPLRVTAVSSNASLVPDPMVTYTSANPTGTVTFAPLADQHGTSIITVMVEDGGLDEDLTTTGDNATTTRQFDVVIHPVNDVPTLGRLVNVRVAEDTPYVGFELLGVSAGGGETEQPVIIKAVSSNADLIVDYDSNVVSQTNLVAHYPLDGNASDASGNEIAGVVHGAIPTVDRFGASSSAYSFDGEGAELVFDYPFPFNHNQDASLSFWLNTPAEGHSAIIWGREDDNCQSRFHLYLEGNGDSGELGFDYFDAGCEGHPIFHADKGTSATIRANEWTHVAITRTESSYSIFIDGDLKQSVTYIANGNLPDASGWQVAGRSGFFFEGSIDDLRLYDRSLSVNDIKTLQSGFNSLTIFPGPNQYGASTITVTVEDGGLDNDLATTGDNATTSESFNVIVDPVNDVPTLDSMGDITTDEDSGEYFVDLKGLAAEPFETHGLNYFVIDAYQAGSTSLVDNLKVTNLDTGEVVLDNSFSTEGKEGLALLHRNSPTEPWAVDSRYARIDAGKVRLETTGFGQNGAGGYDSYAALFYEDSLPEEFQLEYSIERLQSAGHSHLWFFDTYSADLFWGNPNLSAAAKFEGGWGDDLWTRNPENPRSRHDLGALNTERHIKVVKQLGNLSYFIDDVLIESVQLEKVSTLGSLQPLSITAFSDNPGLLLDPQVEFNNNRRTGHLTFVPAPDQHGSTTITVNVEDGGLDNDLATTGDNATTTETFDVVVRAVNDAPTLDPIGADRFTAIFSDNFDSDTAASNAELNKWDISGGSIDVGVVGESTKELGWKDSNGNLVDLDGSSSNGAKITTKEMFNLLPGAYELIFQVSGNDSLVGGDDTFGFGLEGIFSENLTLAPKSPMLEVRRYVEVSTPADTRVFFDHDSAGDNHGIIIDNVQLGRRGLIIDEDAGQQTIELTGITAGGGDTQPLRITATSSNADSIADPTVTYTSADSNGSLKFTPLTDQHGTTTITVTVEDGGMDNHLSTIDDNSTTTKSFEVTVAPVNDPPTIHPIENVVIEQNSENNLIPLDGITAGLNEVQELRVYAADSHLIAAYDLDGTAQDSSGNSLSGQVVGDVNSVSDRHGEIGKAMSFQGGSEKLEFDSPFPFNVDADRSIAFWMKVESQRHEAIVWARSDDEDLNRFHIFTDVVNGKQVVAMDYREPDGNLHPLFHEDKGVGIRTDQWEFIVITRESDTYSIFVNGELGQAVLDVKPSLPNSGEWSMSGRRTWEFNGSLDEVRLFDYALAQEEIESLFIDSSDLVVPRVSYDSDDTEGNLIITPPTDYVGTNTITVTAEDGGLDNDLATTSDNATTSTSFDVTVQEVFAWHNAAMPVDVNNDGTVSSVDALHVINHLNANGSHELSPEKPSNAGWLDVNKDQWVSPADAIAVINHLNSKSYDVSIGVIPVDALGTPITSAEIGETFYLALTTEDLRDDAKGVFAAYADVYYPSTNVVLAGAATFEAPYNNGRSAITDAAGLIDEWGAFAGLSETGRDSYIVSRIPMQATQAGAVLFGTSAADESPIHDVLVFGSIDTVDADFIKFTSAELLILEEAEGEFEGTSEDLIEQIASREEADLLTLDHFFGEF